MHTPPQGGKASCRRRDFAPLSRGPRASFARQDTAARTDARPTFSKDAERRPGPEDAHSPSVLSPGYPQLLRRALARDVRNTGHTRGRYPHI